MDNGTKREKIAEKCFFISTNLLFCNTQITKRPVTINHLMQNWGRNSFLQHLLLRFDRDDRWCATTFVLCPSLYRRPIACILARIRIRTRFNRSFIFLLSQVSHHLLTSRSFTRKQHVVFNKTTRHFQQNNTSFSIKQHVTFTKTTRRFQQNNTLLFRPNEANRPSKNSRTLNYM